ncbi:hypothetical protein ACGFSB_04390 [Streptomyces sp. NPDC048441]|uniref:hypothetical protein n=1 Tax=Streptomyces sp. NPDC048441 TaxID=3365552 RepID=UPI003716EBBC
MSFQDGDLVAQGKDFRVFVAVAQRQQSQRGERVGDGQVGETKQHECLSCRTVEDAHELRG